MIKRLTNTTSAIQKIESENAGFQHDSASPFQVNYLAYINAMPVSFEACDSTDDVDVCKQSLLRQLQDALHRCQMSTGGFFTQARKKAVMDAYQRCVTKINELACQRDDELYLFSIL